MSGLAVICEQRDTPVSQRLLEKMVRFLSWRGPDLQTAKQLNSVAMIHTLLRTTDESVNEQQPWTFDGVTWIVADARIDARSELISKLNSSAERITQDSPDCQLILRAYHKWGNDCLQHLLGDFAFVIANTNSRSFFAARDPMGVKPLFYHQSADRLIVSSELDCVRMHDEVPQQLDDQYIADFLLFGVSLSPQTTALSSIRRLGAGEALTWSDRAFRTWRHWSPAVPTTLKLSRLEEYEEGFLDVLETAVRDRLRTSRVSVSFSGGLDSTSVSAVALKCLAESSGQLHGTTVVYDRIMPDRERYFANLAADKLGLPLTCIVADDLPLFDDTWDSPVTQRPEPSQRNYSVLRELNRSLGDHSRVVLSGNGGDEAIHPARKYYQRLIAEFRCMQLVVDCCKHVWSLRSLPPIGLRTLLYKRHFKKWRQKISPMPSFPAWLNPDFVKKLDLESRWQEIYHSRENSSREPRGKGVMENGMVAASVNCGIDRGLQYPLDYRYPYLDVRVIKYCWSIPVIPLRFDKQLIRRSMKGRLPDEVLKRPKQGLAGSPLLCKPFRFPMTWPEFVARTPEVEQYVIGSPPANSEEASRSLSDVWRDTCPYELASWMHHRWKRG